MRSKLSDDYVKDAFNRIVAEPSGRAILMDVVADNLARIASREPLEIKAGRVGLSVFRSAWGNAGFDSIVAGSSACQTLITLNRLSGADLGLGKR